MQLFGELFKKKLQKFEPAYTYPEAKNKTNRYINFEIEKDRKEYI